MALPKPTIDLHQNSRSRQYSPDPDPDAVCLHGSANRLSGYFAKDEPIRLDCRGEDFAEEGDQFFE